MNAFIVGTGRCGTTILAQMLNSHSTICVPSEIQILFEYSGNGKRLYEVFESGENRRFGAEDFIQLIAQRCPHNFHEYFNYPEFFNKLSYPVVSLAELVNRLYSDIAKSRGKEIFFEQTPWYGQRIDILNGLFPDAKYIHMVRDGRDVAISYARTPWWHNDIGQNLERWHAEITQITNSSSQILKANQMLQVRYEDLVEQPEAVLREICAFLRIDFESAMLDPSTYIDYRMFSKSKNTNVSSSAMNEWSKNKNLPTFLGSRYAWKKFPEFDFQGIPRHIAKTLDAFRYDTVAPTKAL